MEQIQLVQLSSTELTSLITESVTTRFQEILTNFIQKVPNDETEFLTRKETAELFKVSLVTIHEWCNNGILTPYKLGNRTYFKRTELMNSLFNSNRP